MTTISPKRRQTVFGSGTFAGFIVVVILLALGILFRAPISGMLWKVFAPILSIRNSASQTDATQLRAELASTTAALADRNALYAQNLELKQMLGRSADLHTTLAAVLERPPGIPYDTLMIDIGKNNGAAVGTLVYAGGSEAIGTISDVYDTTSRVVLFSAPGQSYQAALTSGTPVSLTGQGAGSLSGEVPAGTTVAVGDGVLLPGIALAFVGSVSHVTQQTGASFITVYMQMPVDIFSLQFVQVQTQ